MNRTTRIIVTVLGLTLALAGMSHGYFETQQGNAPTNSVIIDAISAASRTWLYGGETAFTLLPTFLLAGIASITVSLIIVVWSLCFLHTRHGATVWLALFVLLFLVGGGIGHVVLFTLIWAFATRINAPLTGWGKLLPPAVRPVLGSVWGVPLALAVGGFLHALYIAIFGVSPLMPGVTDPEPLINVVFASLGIALLSVALAFVCGFADDLRRREGVPAAG